MDTLPLHHFYHVYADGTWQDVCEEHLSALRDSGLSERLGPMEIGIVGNAQNRAMVKEFFAQSSTPHRICAESDTGWEQITQNKLHDFAACNDGHVLYAHTKGAWSRNPLTISWRRTMTKYTIFGWREAVARLEEYHAAGCYWTGGFFGGTFWWTRLEHLRKLNKPNVRDRYGAEAWIGEIPSVKPFDLRSPDMRDCNLQAQIELIHRDAAADAGLEPR